MKKKNIAIVIVLIVIFLIATYFWKAFLPNQLRYTTNKYLGEISYHKNTTFEIYDTAKWLKGELVAVEGKEMIGLVYLEKIFGVYKVKNHVLCNKTDTTKESFMKDIDYQCRLLRAKSFADNKDIIMAYVNDAEVDLFEFKNESNELIFQLPKDRKIVFSEVEQLFSVVKIGPEEMFIQWKDESLQDMIKYDANDFICKSENPLSIAVVGEFGFKTDESILIDNSSLDEVYDLDSERYDGLFINSDISNEILDKLVKKNWDVYIIDPLKNLESYADNHIKEDVIILQKSKSGGGRSSKADFYDLESNYFMAYSYIFERLSEIKGELY